MGIRVLTYQHRLACDFCLNYQEHLHRILDVSHDFELHLDELHDDRLPAEARASQSSDLAKFLNANIR